LKANYGILPLVGFFVSRGKARVQRQREPAPGRDHTGKFLRKQEIKT